MAVQPVTLNLPNTLYHQVQRRAEKSHRSVEDELLEVIATAISALDELPREITEAMAQLVFLDDAALERVARSTMASEQVEQMEALNLKQQREGLTPEERQELTQLLRHYEHVMLVRAKAAALLKERGYDVSNPALFTPSS